jgi:transposase
MKKEKLRERAEIIEQLISEESTDKKLSNREAADILDITVGRVYQLKRQARKKGRESLRHHGNEGRPPKNKTSDAIKELIVNLKQTEYKDVSNNAEFHRTLKSERGITKSPTTVSKILKAAGIPAGTRGGSKPGHSQPAPSKIKELDIPEIEMWIKEVEAEMATQKSKNKELQHAIGMLRDVWSAPNPTPQTVNRHVLDIKKIIGELSKLTSTFFAFSKEFNIMKYEKI